MRSEVTVRAECALPEKLLERAIQRGASFAEVRRDGEHGMLVSCDAASAEILLNECARFRLSARVLARRGMSAIRAAARKRATLPVGLLLCAALCWLFLGRIWLIDVSFSGEAAHLGSASELRRQLTEAGVRPGMRRGLNLDALTQSLNASAGAYSYVGAHLRGVRLLIEAVPEVPSPDVYDVSAARDLVADRDGIVLSAIARSGELCVQPGDAVLRGQLLIRGEELEATGEEPRTRPIAALGEVIVRCWYGGEALLPISEIHSHFTGNSDVSSRLRTPWLSLPIAEGARYGDQVTTTEVLPIGGLFVPIEVERTTNWEVVRETARRDSEPLKEQLTALAFADAARRLNLEGPESYEIIERWIDFDQSGDTLAARAVIEISADAAVTRDELLNR